MSKDQKPVWLSIGVIVLALLLNIIILKTAYTDNQNLFWMLIVSIPLLIIAIYNVWQTNHLLRNYFIDSLQPATQQSHFESLSHSIYPNNIATTDLKVQIGNDQCSQPYNACIFNIESMENTKTEKPFIHSLNEETLEYSKYSVDELLNIYR